MNLLRNLLATTFLLISTSQAKLNISSQNFISHCHPKCKCPDTETVICQATITENDLLVRIFSNATTKLDLQNNGLRSIPEEAFSNLPNLKELTLAKNKLEEIPIQILALIPLLKAIDLSENRIKKVNDTSFESNSQLQTINLSHNQINFFSGEALSKKQSLDVLLLNNNNLKSFEKSTFQETPNISILHLQENEFEEIPQEIRTLTKLTELNLGKNFIETVSNGLLQQFNDLEEFDLLGNPLKSFHINAFSRLPNLRRLAIPGIKNNTIFPNLNGTNSLRMFKLDRSNIAHVPSNFCSFCPQLETLDLKGNSLGRLPDLRGCKELKIIDLGHNAIRDLRLDNQGPFETLIHLHDLILHHNKIEKIDKNTFSGLKNLQTLDLMDNNIIEIDDEAFQSLDSLTDLNLGMNMFSKFPSKGLHKLEHIKTHNNPNLIEFPGSTRFPKVQTLVLSYAYHCCQFIPSTFENLMSESGEFFSLKETVIFPGEAHVDHPSWGVNITELSWTLPDPTVESSILSRADHQTIFILPPEGIQCTPTPGTFLPCNDLFDWWTLRCSVWIVFCLALLGNGCVVLVLVASRGKIDVPRFLVCNLAAADFFMGLYLGFLAVVDASTLGEFRRFAISWQFSSACKVAGFFGVLSSVLSIYTLSVITLERNYAITHAMHLNKRLSLRHATYIMICGWIYAIIMASMPLIGVSDYSKFAVCLPFETGDPLSLGYVVFLSLINGVGFSILMGCYLRMYCAIRGSQAWNTNDSRIAKRMALLVFTDFICWFPIALIALSACFGVHLITLEQAKVFTVFVLPLNSCFNPFLYAILTKQFKKDCVMICKTIEESRVTRGIGRCRHSSNFSNRQTPANTNSLNSGSGSHGSNPNPLQPRGQLCNCNLKKPKSPAALLTSNWPFNKLKKIFLEYKDSGEMGAATLTSTNEYAKQIPEAPTKQCKTKRLSSLSSENFSSSRSDSWHLQGLHRLECPQQQLVQKARRNKPETGQFNHRRRNSWTVTRKPSEDSQVSNSRNDSHSSSNSTQTWRLSRSSVSSEMSNVAGKKSRSFNENIPVNAPIDPATGKLNISLVHNQRIHGGSTKIRHPSVQLVKLNENILKPKLIRQPAILADGDSIGSTKSVKFQDPLYSEYIVVDEGGNLIEAVNTCPLHGCEKSKDFYEKLAESCHEESDMEPSDPETDDQDDSSSKSLLKHIPAVVKRKLSTISSKDKDSKEDLSHPEGSLNSSSEPNQDR